MFCGLSLQCLCKFKICFNNLLVLFSSYFFIAFYLYNYIYSHTIWPCIITLKMNVLHQIKKNVDIQSLEMYLVLHAQHHWKIENCQKWHHRNV
jgi:hypothetical protein